MSRSLLHKFALLGLVFCAHGFFTSQARASLILISFDDTPLITAGSGFLDYAAAADNLHAEMVPAAIQVDPLTFGLFDLATSNLVIDFFVDADGKFAGSGTGLTVTGDVDFDNDFITDASGNLLSGAILGFGADPAGPPPWAFNGIFRIDDGALTKTIALSGGGDIFGGFQAGTNSGAFIVFADTVTGGTLGDFSDITSDFSSDNVKGNVGTGSVVPEPASLTIWALGTLACAGLCARKRSRRSRPTCSQHRF